MRVELYPSICAIGLLVASCGAHEQDTTTISNLPVPHANNAVAAGVNESDGLTFYSFNGLTVGKTWEDTSRRAFACPENGNPCRTITDLPVENGRLASVAVTVKNQIYVFGGYTVAVDGSEVSTPAVYRFDPSKETFKRVADMPTPVDDMVAFSYKDRYIYLVSGWHNDGNISLVQVYDVDKDIWFSATDYPGAPVFGHAGGAVDNQVVIADGVAVIGEQDGRRQFGAVNEAWYGEIDEKDPSIIAWRQLPPHSYGPLYRMAAGGDIINQRIVFLGGSDNPYNFNGVGYDGIPSMPSDRIFAYDLVEGEWIDLGRTDVATMDHRGLLVTSDGYCTIGGMDKDLTVLTAVYCHYIK